MRIIPDRLVIKNKTRFDVHCHVFNRKHVPDGFVGIRLPWTRQFFNFLENTVRLIGKIFGNEEISNVKYFLDLFNKSSETITEKLLEYYPEDTIICPLLMDMSPSIKGHQIISYQEQIEDMERLILKFPDRILPFAAMNPLNKHMKTIFNNLFLTGNNFGGIKIYSSMGHLPSHPALMPVYEVCETKGIPVTVHCSGATVHTTEHRFKSIPYMVVGSDGKPVLKEESGWFWTKADYSWFNDPRHWEPVLRLYPKLRLNLAHFGGYEEINSFFKGSDKSWVHRILSLAQRYPNVYFDIAYSLFETKMYKSLRNLLETNDLVRSRMMYGSDYYMVTLEGRFRGIKTGFEMAMGTEIMDIIARKNPQQFLFGIK